MGVSREKLSEPVEPRLPRRASLADPALGRAQRERLYLARAHAPHLVRTHDPARLEHVQVLNDRRQRYRERPRELAHRRGPVEQVVDHRTPVRIRERVEDHVYRRLALRGGILKHPLKYCTSADEIEGGWRTRLRVMRHPRGQSAIRELVTQR